MVTNAKKKQLQIIKVWINSAGLYPIHSNVNATY
jgi:hypothetical protein